MVNPKSLIGLDFETYSDVSLPDHGLHRYVRDSSFRTLLGGIAWCDIFGYTTNHFDFVNNGYDQCKRELRDAIADLTVVAHNVPFEQAVLDRMGLHLPSSQFIDSAVVARAAGAGGKLEAAAPQLLGNDKAEVGKHLMKVFSIPKPGQQGFDPAITTARPQEWYEYGEYCELDAELGLQLVVDWGEILTTQEQDFQQITLEMNAVGWNVDMAKVEEMQRRYLGNQTEALESFREQLDKNGDLNINSHKQLKEWTAARGVKCTSFDEKHVARYLAALDKKLATPNRLTPDQINEYCEVEKLLLLKQTMGGSSLKKLQTIIDTAVPQSDGTYRLMDQYLHCGAGQTLRTTGRSVQMQNLKRLDAENVGNMDELDDPESEWDNDALAENIRQVFTASSSSGYLIVGDFSSVESRGLAWWAGEQWKLDEYRAGSDIYKVLAAKIYHVPYEDVLKSQRQVGKVGELSCGYGAGAGAVKDFASNMGVTFTEAEAAQVVSDWRAANPNIVNKWAELNVMLESVLKAGPSVQGWTMGLPDDITLTIRCESTPASLTKQHPGAQSIGMELLSRGGIVLMRRIFHGCYFRGRDICYYKPSDRKTGDLWRQSFIHPKTKQRTFYKLYGGKLAGILTQSLCRELFFDSLFQVRNWVKTLPNVQLVGQFHDEIVLDWAPSSSSVAISLDLTTVGLEDKMSNPGWARTFPLEADVKYDYRYTK